MRASILKVFVLISFCLFGVAKDSKAQINISPTKQKVCFNSSAIFFLQNVVDTDATFIWQDSSSTGWNAIIGSSTVLGVTNDTIQFFNLNSNFNNYKIRCIVDSAGLGIRKDTTKSSLLLVRTALISPKISTSQNVCFGSIADTLQISQLPSGGDTGFSYQWQKSSNGLLWTDLINATDTFLAIDTFNANSYFRLKANSLSSCGILISDTVFVKFYTQLIKPTIFPKKKFIVCYQDNPDSLSVIPNTGLPIPEFQFQWQISSDNTNWSDLLNDTTSNKLSIQSIIDTAYYRVKATHRFGCGFKFSDTAMVVPLSPVIKPSISGTQTICFNEDPDTLKITTSNLLKSDVTFQWQSSINGTLWTDILGKTTKELALTKNGVTKFYRVKATWQNCTALFTDSVLVSVYQDMNAGTLKTNQTICYGSTPSILSFQNIPSGGGESYTYQWQISSDSLSFADIPGATSLVYPPPSLTSTTFYRVKVNSVLGCGVLNTNIIRIKVYALFVGSDVQSNDTICYNSSPDTLRLITNPAGGNGVYTYIWQSSTDNINWSSISGQTSKNLKPAAIKVTTYYRVVIFSGAGCGSYTSNPITIKVWPTIVKARISSNQNICFNTSADTLRVFQLAQGVNSKFSYQWQLSSNGTSWSDIVGQTALKLFTGNLTSTKYYRVIATSLFGCGSIASDSIKINVYAQLQAAVISGDQNVCYNFIPTKFRVTTMPTGANGLYSYRWQVSSDSINFTDITGATDTALQTNKHLANKFYRLRVTSTLGCGNVLSNIIRVFVYKKFEGAEIGNSVKVCYGYTPVPLYITRKPKGGSLSYNYQWQSSIDSTNWSDIIGQTADTLPMTQLLKTTYFRLINSSTFSCGTDTSNMVTIFSLKLPDTTWVNGLSEVCKNQQLLFYRLEHKSLEYAYDWSIAKGSILTDHTKTGVFITWDNTSGVDTIFIKQTNKETGCFNYMTLPITLKETQAPSLTEIIRKSNSNILVSRDSSAGIHYQWGYINKQTKEAVDISNANLRYVLLPHNFDTTNYIYYLKTWFADCITTTYYNFDPLTLGTPNKKALHLSVFPNPTLGIFQIEGFNLSEVEATCFDVLGNKIDVKINVELNSIEFNSHQPAGIYLLVLDAPQGVYSKRIILNR